MTLARADMALMMSWMTLVGIWCRQVWRMILMQNLWVAREARDFDAKSLGGA